MDSLSSEPIPTKETGLLTKLGGVGISAGVGIYTLLRVSYGAFYGAFGVAPEDVGLDYPAVIFQSIIGLVVLIVIALFVVSFWRVVDQLVAAALNRRAQKLHKAGKARAQIRSVPLRHFGVGAMLIMGLFLLIDEIPRQASEFAQRGKSGRAVTWAGFRIDSIISEKFPLLPYRAEPATVSILGPQNSASREISERESLMFLGSNGETHVLFDYMSEEVVRVPLRSSLVVSRDVARSDSYNFPTFVFLILTALFVVALRVAQALDDKKKLAATAKFLGLTKQ